ncbi:MULTISPECIES: hypothetical protein [unclassified Microbulbifer]|uniref:hypothetical protein n=1 Tax=unclassified Microbulbifer TaxID=2619833 RepID=UPI0027E4131D|nr:MULTISPECIES: hypothetical protein [unclassified Microbulbifer]
MQEIEWKEGVPSLEGLYFIAVRMGPAAGCYDFANWNGSSWEKNIEGDVVAFCDAGSFIQQISIKWPFADNTELSSEPKSGNGTEFEEV